MRVDLWSDVVCPFCYVAERRLRQVAQRQGTALQWHWHSYQLDAAAPATYAVSNAERLARKYGMSIAQAREKLQQIAELCATEGITFNWEPARPGNSRDAHRIIQIAGDRGLGSAAREAMFSAWMTDGKAIGERQCVREIAAALGLDTATIEAALNSETIDARIDADIESAASMGISGVPFFVFAGKLAVSGAQSREVFAQALRQAQ